MSADNQQERREWEGLINRMNILYGSLESNLTIKSKKLEGTHREIRVFLEEDIASLRYAKSELHKIIEDAGKKYS